MSYFIASISNSGGAPEQAYRKMQSAGACPQRPYAEMFKLEVPSLSVGTLDTLMNLSDELGKTDGLIENIVRKIEKCSNDLSTKNNTTSTSGGHAGGGHHSHTPTDLSVGGVPATRYIQQFAWDSAKYPIRRPLKELVTLIASGAASIEEELKQLIQSYTDKVTSLMETKRKKGGNLLSGDLNDILKESNISKIKILNTEYLKTLFIAIPKSAADTFITNIYKISSDLVGYGGPDWTGGDDSTIKLGEPIQYGTLIDRYQKRGSPVVPGSVIKVQEDDDSILYAVTILKGQNECGYYDENNEYHNGTKLDFITEFTHSCKERRYIVRELDEYDPSYSTKNNIYVEQLQVEVDGMKSALNRWCKNHYGDAYVAWIHLKVIRIFVESVLRYGLPVDFTAVLYKIHLHKENDLLHALDKELGNNSVAVANHTKDDAGDGGHEAGEEDFHDFVLLKFDP